MNNFIRTKIGASLRGGNWAAGEPNGGVCVYAMQMKKWMKDRDDGKWKDDSCAVVKPFLCEGGKSCQITLKKARARGNDKGK